MKSKKIAVRVRPSTAAARKALLAKFGQTCAFCGEKLASLEMAFVDHVRPASVGAGLENALLLCPNCHREYDSFQPREAEFRTILCEMMRRTSNYRNVQVEARHEIHSLDLQAEERMHGRWQPLFVETKGYRFLGAPEVNQCIEQIAELREASKIERAVLAFPGSVLPEGRARLVASGIEVWDRAYLEERFHSEISAMRDPRVRLIIGFRAKTPANAAALLEQKLLNCRPGKEDWVIYQTLVRDIFELLFTPALSKPIAEFADATGTNRRDIIMPNFATSGFWRHARETYRADYIVIDAKNYSDPIPKGEVLNVANYLKPFGAGMFAIIVSRFGADAGAVVTLREHWSNAQKLIVVLNDNDVRAMLTMFAAGDAPEQTLADNITKFRLTM